MPENEDLSTSQHTLWNKGKLIGANPPLRPKHVWSIWTKLQVAAEALELRLPGVRVAARLRKPSAGIHNHTH